MLPIRCIQPPCRNIDVKIDPGQRQQIARSDVDPVHDLVRDRPAAQHQQLCPRGVQRQLEEEGHRRSPRSAAASPREIACAGCGRGAERARRAYESDTERRHGASPTSASRTDLDCARSHPYKALRRCGFTAERSRRVGTEIVKTPGRSGRHRGHRSRRGGDGRAGGAQGVHPARSGDHREDEGRPAEAQPPLRAVREGQARARRREGVRPRRGRRWSG